MAPPTGSPASTATPPIACRGRSAGRSPAVALARRAFVDARARTVTFAYIFAVYAWIQPAGYHSAYPTVADRTAFAQNFAVNDAIRLFYGYPYDVVTIGGYSAWRVGGTLALAAAAFGMLAAVRALRTEEETGRTELVLAGAVSRRTAFSGSTAAIYAGAAVLWLAAFAGYVISRLPVAGSAYLALATASVVPVFAGIGALASQLAPTRRMALGLGFGAMASFWLLRVLSDTIPAAAWLRWVTPLGWAEALRPFAGAQPAVLLLPATATAALMTAAARLAFSRDVGAGLLAGRDPSRSSFSLLSSVTALALRRERGTFAAWGLGLAAFAAVFGMIATGISSAGLSKNFERKFARLGSGSITTPTGYLSFVFIVFIFAVCLFVCSQIAAARQEEADEQLETVLAQPVSRTRWFTGRLVIAASAAAVLSALSGLFTWIGAVSQGVSISLGKMLEAGANCLPVAVLFLGLCALGYSVVPRAAVSISYTLVGFSFAWYLVGSLLAVPTWLTDVSPFQHIGLVPAQSFRAGSAAAMVAIGVASALVALTLFRRRDLLGT